MEALHIRGGNPLKGTLQVSGAKNAALPILAATLLSSEPVELRGVPDLSDVHFMAELLRHLGATVDVLDAETGHWRIHTPTLSTHTAPYHLVRKMRASVCLMGPLLSRAKRCKLSLPGGCVIGPRPIDLHLKGFRKLGCKIDIEGGYIDVDASKARGGLIFLGGRQGSTVTGTANVLMAAVCTPGQARIESAACEPEVMDLCHMLVKMGAKISGIGSPVLIIEGVEALGGCTHTILPDRIEAGTFLIGAAMIGGDVTVNGIGADALSALIDTLDGMGIEVQAGQNSLRVAGPGSLELGAKRKPADIVTLPYPGFPTDLQAQMCALLAVTPGLSIVTEKIYPARFMHVPELQRMGAHISIEGPSAIINGVNQLSGAPVMASDLRASAALVLAGLAATGDTWVQRIYHLDRGYQKIDARLRALGANVQRIPASELPNFDG